MSLEFSHETNVATTGAGSLPKRKYKLRHYEPGSIGVLLPGYSSCSDANIEFARNVGYVGAQPIRWPRP